MQKQSQKAVLTLTLEDGTQETMHVIISGDRISEMDSSEIQRGPTLACLLGLHAYSNGVCLNCGRVRPW